MMTTQESLENLDSSDLVDTIITRFHRVHTAELPQLVEMAARVEEVHKSHADVPTGLSAALKALLGELTMHMQKEEIMLFPQMKKGPMMPLHMPITVMMSEHKEHTAEVDDLRRLTHDFTTPADGCATWRALNDGIAKFANDLAEHIHTENDILFPRFLADAA